MEKKVWLVRVRTEFRMVALPERIILVELKSLLYTNSVARTELVRVMIMKRRRKKKGKGVIRGRIQKESEFLSLVFSSP